MIAKVITFADDRTAALAKMRVALDELVISGIKTNTPLQQDLVRDAAFAKVVSTFTTLRKSCNLNKPLAAPPHWRGAHSGHPMPWLELRIDTDRDAAPRWEKALLKAGALSVTLQDNADQPIFEPALGESALWQTTRGDRLFDSEVDTAKLERQMQLPVDAFWQWQLLEDKDWEREWMKDFHPIPVAEHFGSAPAGLRRRARRGEPATGPRPRLWHRHPPDYLYVFGMAEPPDARRPHLY